MRNELVWIALLALAAAAAPDAVAQNQGQGQAVITVLPKHEGEVPPSVSGQDMSVSVNGKQARITHWAPFQGSYSRLELVLLFDSGARNSMGRQMGDTEKFIQSLPPNVVAAVAYMDHGRAVFSGHLSSDHAAVIKNLHLPGAPIGSDANPYFCLSDLARNWPSQDPTVRREVIMVSDGVDSYSPAYDPADPYVEKAIEDAVMAHLVVYPIYWTTNGGFDRSFAANSAGQNLLMAVAQATGGKSFWEGMGNPVSFEPYYDDLLRRFHNQYELAFASALNGKPEIVPLKLKLSAPGTEIDAPQKVLVLPTGASRD